MNKHNSILLKPIKATKSFECYKCDSEIKPSEIYYMQKDKFLQTLSNKRFCSKCFKEHGQKLLEIKKQKLNKEQKKLF